LPGAAGRQLRRLHGRVAGKPAAGQASNCPACETAVEASFRCDDLLIGDAAPSGATLEHHSATHDLCVRFRLPDSTDLLALHACGDASVARQELLDRCVIDIGGGAGQPRALPPGLQTEIAQAMAAADPQADLQLALTCPQCAHRWHPVFDIAHFLWHELHAWALRTLREIDTLAQAYHWSERDILSLSPRRRQAYLELCLP
jgi:hypothetical protein